MRKIFNEGELVYSPKFGKGFVLGINNSKARGAYDMLVRFEDLGDVGYFYDGSHYGRSRPSSEDIVIEAEWREVEE